MLMTSKNILTDGKSLGIAGCILSIIGVFLPWYHASASTGTMGISSSISINGLGWKSGEGVLLGLIEGTADMEYHGMGIIALGIIGIIAAVVLKGKSQSLAILACGLIMIGDGIFNLQRIGSLSGNFMGVTVQYGAGYGLFMVVIAGAAVTAGGLLAWRDIAE